MSFTTEQQHFLTNATPAVVAELRRLIATPRPDDMALYDFQFSGGRSNGMFPFNAFRMDAYAGQLGNDYIDLPVGMRPPDFDYDDCEPLCEWLADRWAEAGGRASGLRAYAFQHDDIRSFDLNTRQWIDDEEKWEE